MQEILRNMTEKEWEAVRSRASLSAKLLPLTMYRLFIINPDSNGLSDKQIQSVENTLRYATRKHPYIKIFIAKSTTDAKSACRTKIKVGGRQQTVIAGKKVAPHVHIGVVGSQEKSAREYVHYVSRLLKRNGLSVRNKSTPDYFHRINYVAYCYKQADTFHQYGNKGLDFKEYLKFDFVTQEKALSQKRGKNTPKYPLTHPKTIFYEDW